MKIRFTTPAFILLFFSTLSLNAQTISDFAWFADDYEDQLFLGLGYNQIRISNNDAPNPDNHKLSGGTLRLDLVKTNFEKGEVRFNYTNKLAGDLILYASQIFKEEKSVYQTEQSFLSTGLLGWFSTTWNINEPEKYQVSLGIHFGDYFLTSAYPEDITKPFSNPSNSIVQEPNGNYYGFGPTAIVDYMLTKHFMLEYKGHLTIPFYRLESEYLVSTGDYKNPYFLNNTLEVITSKGLYGGMELTNIINRGNLPNNTKRFELYLGFRIRL